MQEVEPQTQSRFARFRGLKDLTVKISRPLIMCPSTTLPEFFIGLSVQAKGYRYLATSVAIDPWTNSTLPRHVQIDLTTTKVKVRQLRNLDARINVFTLL
jgi:hypothetical protein